MPNIDARLEIFAQLSAAERRAIEDITADRRIFAKGDVIAEQGDDLRRLFVLHRGVVASGVTLESGEHQFLRLYFPGEMMGAAGLAVSASFDRLTPMTESLVSEVKHTDLGGLFGEHPRVAALMFVYAQEERLALLDRIRGMGRHSANTRIARLLVHIHDRLNGRSSAERRIQLPISQLELGQLAGLSRIHVQRVVRALTLDGLIAWRRSTVEILDFDALRTLASPTECSPVHEAAWLPKAR